MSTHQIEAFKEISGCTDIRVIQQYLEACTGNLEQAVNLFFVQASRKKQKLTNNYSEPSTSKSIPKNGNKSDIKMIDLSDESGDDSGNNIEKVRAPIAPVQGPIVEQTFQQTYGNRRGLSNPIFEQYHDFRELAEQQDNNLRRRIAHSSKTNFDENARAQDFTPNNLTENVELVDVPSSSNGNTRYQNGKTIDHFKTSSKNAKDLKTLFRPPVEIMYQKDWDATILHARQLKRWLLINVQMAMEFSCQVLNRDIWSEPTVREIVQENFVFLQIYHDSSNGVRVCGYYEIREFPAIFVVDPRTGEEVQRLRAQDSVSFLDQVTSFLDNCSSFEARDAIICGKSLNSVALNDELKSQSDKRNTKTRRRKRESDSDVSEKSGVDADGGATIQAKRMKRVVNINDDDANNDMIVDQCSNISSMSDSNISNFTPAEEWRNYIGKVYAYSRPVHVLLKLPSGEKISISLYSTTKLEALFVLIAGHQLSPYEYQFVLSFPKRVFGIDEKRKTLEEADFGRQEVVHVEKI